MNKSENISKKKVDPLEEVINTILKTQAKTCVRAKKLLDDRTKEKQDEK